LRYTATTCHDAQAVETQTAASAHRREQRIDFGQAARVAELKHDKLNSEMEQWREQRSLGARSEQLGTRHIQPPSRIAHRALRIALCRGAGQRCREKLRPRQ